MKYFQKKRKSLNKYSQRTSLKRKSLKKNIHKKKTHKKNNRRYLRKKYPKIIVINLKKDKTKWDKYKKKEYKDNINRYSACYGLDPQSKYESSYKRNEKNLQIMWNADKKKKKCTAGILTSHLGVIKLIHKNKKNFPKNGVFILEDDAIIDFKKLHDFMKQVHKFQDSIIYLGGTLHPPDTFKNKEWYNHIDKLRKTFQKNKINKIDSSKFRILGGHGYYFPNWDTVDNLLNEIQKKKKIRALDSEMVKLQKKNFIKYFY